MNMAALTETTQTLMRLVVNSGCIRDSATHHAADVTLAVRVMREELKAFLDTENPKYADERAIVMTAATGLAMMSLTAECIRRITMERAN